MRQFIFIIFILASHSCLSLETASQGSIELITEKLESKNSHFEVVVNVGSAYLECGHYHDLHIIEHLVYTRLNSVLLGFKINNPIEAQTELLRLRYSFNLPADFSNDPKKIRDIIAAISNPDWEAFEIERNVVAQEYSEKGTLNESVNAFVDLTRVSTIQIGGACAQIPSIEKANIKGAKEVFANFYQRASKTIVVTGGFNEEVVRAVLSEFQPKNFSVSKFPEFDSNSKPTIGLLSNKIIATLPLPGLKILNGSYLILMRNRVKSELIGKLRYQKGWIYSPSVEIKSNDAVGLITIEFAVGNNHIIEAANIVKGILSSNMITETINKDELEILTNQYRSNDLTAVSRGIQQADYRLGIMSEFGFSAPEKTTILAPKFSAADIQVIDYCTIRGWPTFLPNLRLCF